MELITNRLQIESFSSSDLAAILAIHQNPDLIRFIPSAAAQNETDAERHLERFTTFDGDCPLGFWKVRLKAGPTVGMLLLKPIPASTGVELSDIEIGWRGHPDHTGRGYITEAATSLLDAALASGILRVVAVTDPLNLASQRVARKIGMTDMGLTTDYYDAECQLFVATQG